MERVNIICIHSMSLRRCIFNRRRDEVRSVDPVYKWTMLDDVDWPVDHSVNACKIFTWHITTKSHKFMHSTRLYLGFLVENNEETQPLLCASSKSTLICELVQSAVGRQARHGGIIVDNKSQVNWIIAVKKLVEGLIRSFIQGLLTLYATAAWL